MASIRKNLIYQTAYEVLILILPLILSPYVARVLGAEQVGVYSYTFTMANYFVLFANLGIKNYGNREIARVRDDQNKLSTTFSGIVILHFCLSIITIFAYVVYIVILNSDYRLYTVISGLYVISALFDISWFFFGIEQFKITVLRNGIIRIASTICIFIFVNSPDDLWIYVTILAVSNLFGQLYLWRYVRKYTKLVKVNRNDITRHLPSMAVLFIPSIAISLYNYMDKIMVGAISGSTQLGYYEMSEKIPAIAIAVVGSVGTVMMPRMSNVFAKGDIKQGKKYIDASMQFVMWLSVAMAFGVASVSKVFSPVFWGIEFSSCALLLMLLSIILPIKGFANVVRTQYLIPSKNDRQYVISVCAGAVVNLVINWLLIPTMQSIGAVIGTVIAEFTVCFVQSFACRKELNIGHYIKESIPFLLIGLVMGIVVWFIGEKMQTNILTLLVQVIVGIIVYLGISIVYFKVTHNELFLKAFNGVVKRVKH